jgi:hypothetical protein
VSGKHSNLKNGAALFLSVKNIGNALSYKPHSVLLQSLPFQFRRKSAN